MGCGVRIAVRRVMGTPRWGHSAAGHARHAMPPEISNPVYRCAGFGPVMVGP